MATTQDCRVGTIVRHQNELCQILTWQHTMPGKGGAFYQAKMRNLRTGRLVEYRYRSGETVDVARVEHRTLQYLYPEGDSYVCMDNESYEQLPIPGFMFGDAAGFLKEGMEVTVGFDGENPVVAEAPNFVELEITYTEPGIRGDTATTTLKPATVETGAEVRVPLFVNNGDMVRIDTRTGGYIERVKK